MRIRISSQCEHDSGRLFFFSPFTIAIIPLHPSHPSDSGERQIRLAGFPVLGKRRFGLLAKTVRSRSGCYPGSSRSEAG